MACFPSGNYCNAATFPSGSCSKSEALPTCKKCPEKCATCLPNGGDCRSCQEGTFLTNGSCSSLSNCKGYFDQGSLKQPVTKYGDLGLKLMLADGRSTTAGVCLLDEDKERVYEVFPCTALLPEGERSCTPASTASAANTCSDAGYMLFTFRNARHYALMVQAYGLVNMQRYSVRNLFLETRKEDLRHSAISPSISKVLPASPTLKSYLLVLLSSPTFESILSQRGFALLSSPR